MQARTYLALGLSCALACGDDDADDASSPVEAGSSEAGTRADAAAGSAMDASIPRLDATVVMAEASLAMPEAGLDRDAQILRGKYIANVIYPCGGCHTPRNTMDKAFSGVDCWADTAPMDGDAGCLSSRNLTDHSTGIGNLSDTEVKNAFLHGMRSDGKALHPQMPYALLGNMHEEDADAIVAYLRSLPPIDHRVQPNQPPFDVQPDMPAPGWPDALIPMPRADYAEYQAALRGRYLAGNFGGCMDCHTPRSMAGAQLRDKAFSGGRKFGDTYSPNLTPDPTGIEAYTIEDIVGAIKRGEDPDQGYSKLCPPMPSGPMGAYGGMTDDDARDIAHYLFSIAPVENMIAGDCKPDAGI